MGDRGDVGEGCEGGEGGDVGEGAQTCNNVGGLFFRPDFSAGFFVSRGFFIGCSFQRGCVVGVAGAACFHGIA